MKIEKHDILENVYLPREDSFFFLDEIIDLIIEDLIEVGCGSGYIVLNIAERSPSSNFIATDLNYTACSNTLINSKKYNIPNIQLVTTDLIRCFRKNSIPKTLIFNPPYLPAEKEMDLFLNEKEILQFVGGPKGHETGDRLIQILPRGCILFLIVSSQSIRYQDYLKLHQSIEITKVNTLKLKDNEELHLIKVRKNN